MNEPTLSIKEKNLLVQTCLLAGKILIENGSELNRVSDTIKRIAANAGVPNLRAYVTITGIMISIDDDDTVAKIAEIDQRDFDLRRIEVVNRLSRKFAAHQITLHRFYRMLQKIPYFGRYYQFWQRLLAAALLSGMISVIFTHDYGDFWLTSVVGMLGWLIYQGVRKRVTASFISEFVAATVIGMVAIMAVRLGLGHSADNIIIGAVMPLVPGVQITNAVRDLIYGNLISGPARGIEALICACALGFGVSLALIWLG